MNPLLNPIPYNSPPKLSDGAKIKALQEEVRTLQKADKEKDRKLKALGEQVNQLIQALATSTQTVTTQLQTLADSTGSRLSSLEASGAARDLERATRAQEAAKQETTYAAVVKKNADLEQKVAVLSNTASRTAQAVLHQRFRLVNIFVGKPIDDLDDSADATPIFQQILQEVMPGSPPQIAPQDCHFHICRNRRRQLRARLPSIEDRRYLHHNFNRMPKSYNIVTYAARSPEQRARQKRTKASNNT